VPITQGVATPPACGVDTLGKTGADAKAIEKKQAEQTEVPADMQAIAAEWEAWAGKQHLAGKGALADYANPEQMNRYTWYEVHGWKLPYPGDSKIHAPSQVPGAFIPNREVEGVVSSIDVD
jgi:hypothetical protein